jgi:hypothetical protein
MSPSLGQLSRALQDECFPFNLSHSGLHRSFLPCFPVCIWERSCRLSRLASGQSLFAGHELSPVALAQRPDLRLFALRLRRFRLTARLSLGCGDLLAGARFVRVTGLLPPMLASPNRGRFSEFPNLLPINAWQSAQPVTAQSRGLDQRRRT